MEKILAIYNEMRAAARAWLCASHEFYAQDGDPIRSLAGSSSATT